MIGNKIKILGILNTGPLVIYWTFSIPRNFKRKTVSECMGDHYIGLIAAK